MSDPVLRLVEVHKRFGEFSAVDGINLEVRPGQVFGFLGPNGAGKTTTLRMISGLLQPSSGRIDVCGIDIQRDALGAKRHIGFIGDRPFLYEKLTGAEFLRFVGGAWIRPTSHSSRAIGLRASTCKAGRASRSRPTRTACASGCFCALRCFTARGC